MGQGSEFALAVTWAVKLDVRDPVRMPPMALMFIAGTAKLMVQVRWPAWTYSKVDSVDVLVPLVALAGLALGRGE